MFARTERLLLRPGWTEDAPALAAAINREEIAHNLAHVPWPYSVDDAEDFLTRERDSKEASMLIFERTATEPRLIGGIALSDAKLSDHARQTILGYWIVPSCWGKGFATEAGRAVIDMARETLRIGRLTAQHFVDNPASGAVLRKLGFHQTGDRGPLFSVGRQIASPGLSYTLDLKAATLTA
ncbi:GNAT family protein [Sphingomonas sp.]|uniref:GNAT family N-acetyltransferase n=1 Tax=Sphingomonas sp. TaxID=28214 RepID=UPI0025E862B2|nr:GNAT family protein [Sphingomonas sp.]